MEQNHPEFPELRCSEHKTPIILVSPDFKEGEKNFFCSRCIASGANKSGIDLMVIEDFVSYLATPSGINVPHSAEASQLATERNTRVQQFSTHINDEQSQISNLSKELQNQYTEKCNEMVAELKTVLEGQKDIYANYFTRFQQELTVDNEQAANIPKFEEIRSHVTSLEDLAEIETYLARTVKQKEAWKAASAEVRTLGKRTEDFYREQIENISANQPTFASKDAILSLWQTGLDALIERVKNQSGCFSHLYESIQGVTLNIQNAWEVALLTNSMIKPDTELVLNFSKRNVTEAEAQQIRADLGHLTNLTHLTLIFDSSQIATSTPQEVLQGVAALTQLTFLHVNVYGNKLGDAFTSTLGSTIGVLTNLVNLQLELGMNDLTSVAVENIVQHWGNLTNLRRLTFDAKYNKITDATALANAISNLNVALTHLNVSFGGYSISKNSLSTESSKLLVRSIRHLVNLTNLNLDLGYTGLDDATAIELSQSLKDLVTLRSVNLQLYQNALEAKGAAKIVKRLSKAAKLTNTVVNFNFNDKIRQDGAREIVSSFRQTQQLINLELLLIKVGVDKENAIVFKDDLTRNKLGSAFERVVVLF